MIALAVRSSVVQAFWVPSGSMLPTIQIGDHIFVNKLAYAVHLPLIGTELWKVGDLQRNDIVVFISPIDRSTDLIKRVIAVPGDTVEIRSKKVFVNGEPIPDSHAHFSDSTIMPNGSRDNMPPTQVPEGKFFVMGDNRDRSYDSRFWGFANIADIKGKATFIYWSRDTSKGWLRRRASSASATSSSRRRRQRRRDAHSRAQPSTRRGELRPSPSGTVRVPARTPERSRVMAGGKTFKRDQKRRKEMARKLKQEEKMRKRPAAQGREEDARRAGRRARPRAKPELELD